MAGSIALNDLATFQFLTEQMSVQQKLYIEARCNGSSPVAAARMAGYRDPDHEALRLEADTTVRAAVESAIRVKSRQLAITRNDVLNGFLDAARIASTAMEQIAAWREIGKMIGAYEPDKPQEKDVTPTKDQLENLSDDELAQRAGIEGELIDFEPVKRA